jgi:hypothetical protein
MCTCVCVVIRVNVVVGEVGCHVGCHVGCRVSCRLGVGWVCRVGAAGVRHMWVICDGCGWVWVRYGW